MSTLTTAFLPPPRICAFVNCHQVCQVGSGYCPHCQAGVTSYYASLICTYCQAPARSSTILSPPRDSIHYCGTNQVCLPTGHYHVFRTPY